jgi:hypothetical protein
VSCYTFTVLRPYRGSPAEKAFDRTALAKFFVISGDIAGLPLSLCEGRGSPADERVWSSSVRLTAASAGC